MFPRENFQTSFPAEVTINAINFDPDSTPIDSNISFLVISYLSCFDIQRETDYKTTFLANFALTTPLTSSKDLTPKFCQFMSERLVFFKCQLFLYET
jgi:hypothetical protein